MSILALHTIAVAGVCLFALSFGTWRERFAGLACQAAYTTGCLLAVLAADYAAWHGLLTGTTLVTCFLYLSWKSPHPWPVWACAAQLISIMTSISALIHGIEKQAFLIVQLVISYGVLFALFTGAFMAMKEARLQSTK